MIIQYNIVVTSINLINNATQKFSKTIEDEITAATDGLLYNNYHVLSKGVYILDIFKDEVDAYCQEQGIESSSVEVDEFEIVSLTDRVDVFFESPESVDNSLSLRPIIKAYVYPKHDELKIPNLVGVAYDDTTIVWSWPEDESYAHYLVEDVEPDDPTKEESSQRVIAQLPIGTKTYTETGLTPDTAYTRRLINYTDEQTSVPSASVTVRTETVAPVESLETYTVPKNYDFTTNNNEREIIKENLPAFYSGVGDFNDLKVYKQMDTDFYQKFKAYFEIKGRRFQREKRYDQIGFNYKLCLEAQEEIEEQEGEVTFDAEAYPREWVAIEDYMWATAPVTIYARVKATIFLRKECEEQETEELKLLKPKFKNETIEGEDEFVGNPLGVVFILDRTNSLEHSNKIIELCGGPGHIPMRNAAKNCINKIEQKANQIRQNTGNQVTVKYAVISFGKGATLLTNGFVSAQIAKEKINTITPTDGSTSWGDGIRAANKLINDHPISNDAKYIAYFFSDGFPNKPSNTNNHSPDWYDSYTDGTYQGVHYSQSFSTGTTNAHGCSIKSDLQSLTNTMHHKYTEVGAFICNFGHNSYTTIVDTSAGGNTLYKADYIKTMHRMVATRNEYARFWNSASAMEQVMTDFIDAFTTHTDDQTIKVFDKWVETTETSLVNSYEIDSIKAVTVTSEPYPFTFNNAITPVEYKRNEKRAIVPLSSFLTATEVTNANLYNIILNLAKQTEEWHDGYNKTIGTVESNGEPDKFLIANLYIQDTYNFADEDPITENNFGQSTYEDGMEGTVNVFTTIDKIDTPTYLGDDDGMDCYLVEDSDKSKIYVQGYTDAIIYDYLMYVREELNKYDRESDILTGPSVINNAWLKNRKKKTLNYIDGGGTEPLSHAIDLVEKDDDIWIENYPTLDMAGTWVLVPNMTYDLIAHNDRWYGSPVLNYRFNLEDPDAKTSLYEIMPDCNPDCDYLHVVILHVYYAKNVWISSKDNYHGDPEPWMHIIADKGDQCLGTIGYDYKGRPILIEEYYQWTKKEWQHGVGQDNGWYIDEYLWFMAKPMVKIQDYYDELPGEGMETFYGLVNGRYRTDNPSGKDDLIVNTPQFNIPTTVTDKHSDSIRIYAMITEISPNTGLVSYKWEHPWNHIDGITQVNGDYLYFSSDSMTYKDIEYIDTIATINYENQEIFDNKNVEKIYQLQKPETIYKYQNYYLNITTDNSDVLPMRFPTEIQFDENGLSEIGAVFKGVVNATSKWSPRIHNGYYYLNQHEYFAYAEFNVEANFDTYEEISYKTANGYVSVEVNLKKPPKPMQKYYVSKTTRSELLQDEKRFVWVNERGLTIKPIIDGEYYKEYTSVQYLSPKITFDNVLTQAYPLTVEFDFDDIDNADDIYVPMDIRYYDVENLQWSNWEPFENGNIPPVLSNAYQLRFNLEASVYNTDKLVEDYLCCYLDWKDDQSEPNVTNIVTITDYMTTGPYDAPGTYISKVFDYGCQSDLSLDIFESNYKKKVSLYIASADKEENLLLENINWINITDGKDIKISGRYFRYKIEIPSGEKVYWLHKVLNTKESHVSLPYITKISMNGDYAPEAETTNFINVESFEIPKDGEYHEVFPSVFNIIGADVIARGYQVEHIEKVSIKCITEGIFIDYNKNIDNPYPSKTVLDSPISAMTVFDVSITHKKTPYILSELNEYNNEIIIIKGTPLQYCPITIEDKEGNTYTQIFDEDLESSCECSMKCKEEYVIKVPEKYIELRKNNYELATFKVSINDEEISNDKYAIINHLVIFNDFLEKEDKVTIRYMIPNSFVAKIDRENNLTTIYLYTDQERRNILLSNPEAIANKYKVFFETSTSNNKFIAKDLSMNPMHRTDYKGFIYLTDEHNEPYKINIYCNPLRLKAGGYDKVDIQVEVLDIQDNPIISKDVAVDCKYGIITCENYTTDMNGVIHLVYESSILPSIDTVLARVTTDDNTIISESISIISE